MDSENSIVYCKQCLLAKRKICPIQKEKDEREGNPFKEIVGCNDGIIDPNWCGDFVARDAVLEAIDKSHYDLFYADSNFALQEEIRKLPPAKVRTEKRGRWLPTKSKEKLRCSKCDVIAMIAQYPHGEANFCPNCGADMREES